MSALQGKVALATGAASGIGFASAKRFAAEGATVIGVDLNDSAAWEQVTAKQTARRAYAQGATQIGERAWVRLGIDGMVGQATHFFHEGGGSGDTTTLTATQRRNRRRRRVHA